LEAKFHREEQKRCGHKRTGAREGQCERINSRMGFEKEGGKL